MPTLYRDGKPLLLCREADAEIRERISAEGLTLLHDPRPEQIDTLLQRLESEQIKGYVWESAAAEELLQALETRYAPMEAAGGLVTNPAGEILLMFRRGKWDLPKGKMDPGETPEDTALREVSEETGLHSIGITATLPDTWHAYSQDGRRILKRTHWYRMSFTGQELTVPQIEEDIIDIQWIRPENIARYLPYSYPNLRSVFRHAGYAV